MINLRNCGPKILIRANAKIMAKIMKEEFRKIIDIALQEDCAFDDITTDLTIDKYHQVSFAINAREDLCLCGVEIINLCFASLKNSLKFADATINLQILAKDGDFLPQNTAIAQGSGSAALIFAAERVILNLIQHLSGIATLTAQFVQQLDNPQIKILDTRKTLAGLRAIQKYAVKIGGGQNHRFNLNDMILIKDNHIAASNDITDAITKCRKNSVLKIEIECDNLSQVKNAIKSAPDVIMLDNMSVEEIAEAIKIIDKKAKIEISGGINLNNIKKYAKLDIDFISIGALTHSSRAVDIGLDVF